MLLLQKEGLSAESLYCSEFLHAEYRGLLLLTSLSTCMGEDFSCLSPQVP